MDKKETKKELRETLQKLELHLALGEYRVFPPEEKRELKREIKDLRKKIRNIMVNPVSRRVV